MYTCTLTVYDLPHDGTQTVEVRLDRGPGPPEYLGGEPVVGAVLDLFLHDAEAAGTGGRRHVVAGRVLGQLPGAHTPHHRCQLCPIIVTLSMSVS